MFRHKVKPTIGGSCAFQISLISSEEHFPSYRGKVGITTTKISNRARTYHVHIKLTQFIAEIMGKQHSKFPDFGKESSSLKTKLHVREIDGH